MSSLQSLLGSAGHKIPKVRDGVDMSSEFSKAIYKLRLEKKLSQRRAAQELGISQALLSHYENGVRQPKLDFVRKLAQYYEVSADELLGVLDGNAPKMLKCETRLISELTELLAQAKDLGGENAATAIVNYFRSGAENVRLIIEDPNAPYNPQLRIDIKTAEAAIYTAVRGKGVSE